MNLFKGIAATLFICLIAVQPAQGGLPSLTGRDRSENGLRPPAEQLRRRIPLPAPPIICPRTDDGCTDPVLSGQNGPGGGK